MIHTLKLIEIAAEKNHMGLGVGNDPKSGKTVNTHGKICWEIVPCMAAIITASRLHGWLSL